MHVHMNVVYGCVYINSGLIWFDINPNNTITHEYMHIIIVGINLCYEYMHVIIIEQFVLMFICTINYLFI